MSQSDFVKIAVFYDGNYFSHVSNYYHFDHKRKSRISIHGLHQFIRHEIAQQDEIDLRYCHIVDAHYFRGRLRAFDAEQRDMLFKDRLFDEALIREGVTTHYLPLAPEGEKGIDVWMALEAFELALLKHYDVCVLIAGDSDFLPLVRKLNTIGTRVMVLGWDFDTATQNGKARSTRTSQALMEEATYSVMMQDIIGGKIEFDSAIVDGIFMSGQEVRSRTENPDRESASIAETPERENVSRTDAEFEELRVTGRIQNLKDNYGFIKPDAGGSNVFFFHSEVRNALFSEVKLGDDVSYSMVINERGMCAVDVDVVVV